MYLEKFYFLEQIVSSSLKITPKVLVQMHHTDR